MAQKTEVSGMNYNWLKRLGTISGWAVLVSVIYLLAAPFSALLPVLLPNGFNMPILSGTMDFLLVPAGWLDESTEFYRTYTQWISEWIFSDVYPHLL